MLEKMVSEVSRCSEICSGFMLSMCLVKTSDLLLHYMGTKLTAGLVCCAFQNVKNVMNSEWNPSLGRNCWVLHQASWERLRHSLIGANVMMLLFSASMSRTSGPNCRTPREPFRACKVVCAPCPLLVTMPLEPSMHKSWSRTMPWAALHHIVWPMKMRDGTLTVLGPSALQASNPEKTWPGSSIECHCLRLSWARPSQQHCCQKSWNPTHPWGRNGVGFYGGGWGWFIGSSRDLPWYLHCHKECQHIHQRSFLWYIAPVVWMINWPFPWQAGQVNLTWIRFTNKI